MRKILKVMAVLLVVVITGLALVAFYVKKALPDVGDAPDIQVERTKDRIEKGKYLANHVVACMDCHSQRDWTVYGAPIKEGTFGAGGERFGKEMQFPGTLYSPNITPYALNSWTDGEIFRAITTGQSKHGKALFPLMGYLNYGKMDKEDVYSIIAYLRTIPAITNDVPERELDFPVNFIVNTIPAKASLTPRPAKTDEVAYGKYLATIANCADCHSQFDNKGNMIEGTEFGGGRTFNFPGGLIVTTPNITADAETGIGNWTSDLFVQKFKLYSDSTYQQQKLGENDFNTPMPWFMYTGMDSTDLTAIFKYLGSVKKIKNKVTRFVKQ
ncbi:c-type cytochrome [Pseudobacter ginsenosidimutans]|uniref:Cytochrome c n=1 Tax=Pseudobacter ginsenosidimutans TaxID=661488 RepID=A0A4V2F1R0_9BACT|nr:c-type cytochrome [Pseudobacter ginsenosidimutans]QEC43282.1 c-type cytochrome [Pseudobacter ginsenosidimutans]RZS74646.1 cytochrome c [Pseudobacter ginsenosidimutans]